MVTLNEILGDLFRYFITFISGLYALMLVLFLLLRLVIGNRLWLIAALSNFTPYCFLPLLVLIVLGLIARAKWGIIVTLPVIGIGLLMFVGLFLPKNLPQADGQTLHVATISVYSGNTTVSQVINWINHSDPDVVALQEVADSQLLLLAYQLGSTYPYINVQKAARDQVSILLLSKYPIVSTTSDDAQNSNIEIRYVIDWNEQAVAIHNINLAIPTGKERLKFPLLGKWFSQLILSYDDTSRNDAIHNLLARIQEEKLPFIVVGDFAMSDQAQIYRDVVGTMGDSFRETSTGFGATWPVEGALGLLPKFVPPLFRIDYIWHSSQFRAISSQRGSYLGSDHLPLEATLEMLPAA